MFADFKFIVLWWLTLFLLSSLALPLAFSLFRNFWDRGYIFAKIISLGLLTYLIFVLSVFRILPFSYASLYLLIALALIANFYYFFHRRFAHWQIFKKIISQKYRIFIAEESIFFFILSLWTFVRGFAPEIEGLEKYMDWGFVNSALRSRYFPPVDMWFAGESINYYYFGHVIFAVLTKLSTISSAISYNLAIATTAAVTFVSGFSLASNLVYLYYSSVIKGLKKLLKTSIFAGLVSAFLLTFGGNLHTVYKVAKINIEQNGRLTLTKEALVNAADSYWYPDATRFIGYDPDTTDKTIHEFPMYSFVVADLHGHMNDIAVVLFFMAFLVAVTTLSGTIPPNLYRWLLVLPTSLTLSLAFMTNAWDFAVYGLLFAFFSFLVNYSTLPKGRSHLITTLSNGLLVIVFWYLFTLPFSLQFIPMAEGLQWSDARSPFYQLFVLYGGFWLMTLPFLFYLLYRRLKDNRSLTRFNTSDLFVLALILVATLLVIIPEVGFIKDIYIFEHRRSNTMFKLVYQAFIMYSIAAGYVLIRLRQALANRYLISLFQAIFILVFLSHLIYPYFSIRSYYGLKEYKGIDGLTYLKDRYPDSYLAVQWLNKNVGGQPVIIEAVGDSYTDFNHISSATGLPTIEGWVVHEWLWRGGYDLPGAREEDVRQVYESEDIDAVRSVLQKYAVEYAILGVKEREKYENLQEKNFEKVGGQLVFSSGDTLIYRLPH